MFYSDQSEALQCEGCIKLLQSDTESEMNKSVLYMCFIHAWSKILYTINYSVPVCSKMYIKTMVTMNMHSAHMYARKHK